MTEILKLSKLSENDRVAEVNVGTGWIDTELDAQRPAKRELFAQLRLTDDLRCALFQKNERFIRLHDPSRNGAPAAASALFVFV
jgi:hypothetical protein